MDSKICQLGSQPNGWERGQTIAVKQVWQAKKESIEEREAAKKRAREITGINQADYSRLSNAGKDHTAVKGFDEAARQVASELPELGLGRGADSDGYDDTDYAAAVWDLIGEGKVTAPARHDPEILEEAAGLLKQSRDWDKPKRRPASEYSRPVPFSVDDDQPREPKGKSTGGQFAKKGSGSRKSDQDAQYGGKSKQRNNATLSAESKK